MRILNPIVDLDETLIFLREPKMVYFDDSWYGDAIAYYRSKRIVVPSICPKCHQKKSLIAVRIITCINGRWRYYITPVCQDCWDNRSKGMNTSSFFVARFFLCPNINPEMLEHQKT